MDLVFKLFKRFIISRQSSNIDNSRKILLTSWDTMGKGRKGSVRLGLSYLNQFVNFFRPWLDFCQQNSGEEWPRANGTSWIFHAILDHLYYYYYSFIYYYYYSFTPLIFSVTGGMSKLTSNFYSHVAEKLSKKQQTPYSVTMGLIGCRLSFALLLGRFSALHLNFRWLKAACNFNFYLNYCTLLLCLQS